MQRILLLMGVLISCMNALAEPVDDMVNNLMTANQIPGLVLQVVHHGQTIKTAAYGQANLEWNIPATPETVFEIGSITKQFTAACILILVQDGKLSLDDPISRHLTNTPASWSDITIRHLLTHTSGITNYTGLDGFELSRHLTQPQFITQIGVQPKLFATGTQYSYCNTGYNLLGFIIENVSGQPYWDFLTARILQPLGMTATVKREPGNILARRAAGYDFVAGHPVNRDVNYTDLFSAGEIASTVGDLMKWNAGLDSAKLLGDSAKSQWWTAGKLNDGTPIGYGFGWFLNPLAGHRCQAHGGATSGFSAANLRFPDDGLELVVLSNCGKEGVANTVAQAVAKSYLAGKN